MQGVIVSIWRLKLSTQQLAPKQSSQYQITPTWSLQTNSLSLEHSEMPQDLPPSGGYEPVQYKVT